MSGAPIVTEPQEFRHVEAPFLDLPEWLLPQQLAVVEIVGRQRAVGRIPAGHAEEIDEIVQVEAIRRAGLRIVIVFRAVLGLLFVILALEQLVDLRDIGAVDDIDAAMRIDRAASPFDAACG